MARRFKRRDADAVGACAHIGLDTRIMALAIILSLGEGGEKGGAQSGGGLQQAERLDAVEATLGGFKAEGLFSVAREIKIMRLAGSDCLKRCRRRQRGDRALRRRRGPRKGHEPVAFRRGNGDGQCAAVFARCLAALAEGNGCAADIAGADQPARRHAQAEDEFAGRRFCGRWRGGGRRIGLRLGGCGFLRRGRDDGGRRALQNAQRRTADVGGQCARKSPHHKPRSAVGEELEVILLVQRLHTEIQGFAGGRGRSGAHIEAGLAESEIEHALRAVHRFQP